MAKKRLESRIVKGESLKLYQRMDLKIADPNLLESLQKKNSKINLKESAGVSTQRKLIVTVEGIHTGMTKNLTFYPGPTLDESTTSWTTPHNKPVLKNHDELTEPLGRIISAEYVESALVAGRDTVRMKLEITDAAAIERVLDGRYLTLSVGGSANKVTCSTCGKDLIKEGFCGHYRGKKYEGKTDVTHWMIGEYTGDEISFVNMPADVFAQVISMELVTAGEGGNNMTKKKGEAATKKTAESTEENPLDLIGALTESEDDEEQEIDDELEENTDNEDQEEDEAEKSEDTDESKKGDNEEDAEENEDEEEDDAEKQGESIDTLKTKLAEAEAQVAELKTKLEESEASVTSVTAELEEASGNVTRLEGELQESNDNLSSAEEERDTFQRQNLALARYSKKLLAERAVDLRIMQGKDKSDNREALIESYMSSSPKMLERTISDLFTSGQRFIARVTSPGYVPESNEEGESIEESFNKDANGSGKESTIKKRLTMAEFEREAVSSLSRQS